MSPEKQRIKIAEACGWNYHGNPQVKNWAIMVWSAPGEPCWNTRQLPNFLNDLNAMHEAEMTLSDQSPGKDEKGNVISSDRARYRIELCVVCAMNGGPIHATAAQRAEAFLKTLKLWEKE